MFSMHTTIGWDDVFRKIVPPSSSLILIGGLFSEKIGLSQKKWGEDGEGERER